jgi:hypothetical protein
LAPEQGNLCVIDEIVLVNDRPSHAIRKSVRKTEPITFRWKHLDIEPGEIVLHPNSLIAVTDVQLDNQVNEDWNEDVPVVPQKVGLIWKKPGKIIGVEHLDSLNHNKAEKAFRFISNYGPKEPFLYHVVLPRGYSCDPLLVKSKPKEIIQNMPVRTDLITRGKQQSITWRECPAHSNDFLIYFFGPDDPKIIDNQQTKLSPDIDAAVTDSEFKKYLDVDNREVKDKIDRNLDRY